MSDLQDKIILVTGATDGIGKATARALARRGAQVILLGRNGAKAEAVRQEISAATGNQRVEVVLADLSDLGQVRAVAAEINARYPRLDVLVNNAGLMFGATRQLSVDGNELTLATNHLGPFLLTSLLFDLLRRSPAARIVNVASDAYQFSRPTLDDIQSERRYDALTEYSNTKLWNVMFTLELDRRLRAHGIGNVTTNALHPGLVASRFGTGANGFFGMFLKFWRPFMISPEKGAETSIFLAADAGAATASGSYFAKKKAQVVKSRFNTPTNNQRLWEISEDLTGTTFLADVAGPA